MKLAAIDIGTNSIHMVIARANGRQDFEIIDQEKEMVKLGERVFATNRLSDRAFKEGLDTIRRYVQLADQRGVDEIVTAATSATREARNGGEFLDEVVRQTGLAPEVISGSKEARLIFLAVRNAIDLQGRNALVIDIGGGSTEIVVGNEEEIFFGESIKLGVLRLLDMFKGQGPVGEEARGVLEAHIRFVAQRAIEKAREIGFSLVIGTSGTIRTLGEAAHLAAGGPSLRSVNAEMVSLKDLQTMTDRLLTMEAEKRSAVEAISERRIDAIHLGGVLLTQLLQLAGVQEMTLCEASLREGLILDYLERHGQQLKNLPEQKDLRHRSAMQLAIKFDVDWQQHAHVAGLALQIFDQITSLHRLGDFERDILDFAALLHGVGQYIRFQSYHKHSRYIIKHSDLRGFTDEEILLIGHVARYQRKGRPKKRHKKYRRLSKNQRRAVAVLAGILRIAIALDRTKNQLVEQVQCEVNKKRLILRLSGKAPFELEAWAASNQQKALEKALKVKISIEEMG